MLPFHDHDDEDDLQRWLSGHPGWPLGHETASATLEVRLVGDDCHLYDAARARAIELLALDAGRDDPRARRARELLDAVVEELTA